MGNNDLTLEKLKIDERLREVEKQLGEAKIIRENINNSFAEFKESVKELKESLDSIKKYLMGDPETGKDGIEQRLAKIENAEIGRKKTVGSILKIALGALTMSVGAAMLWLFKIIKSALIGQ